MANIKELGFLLEAIQNARAYNIVFDMGCFIGFTYHHKTICESWKVCIAGLLAISKGITPHFSDEWWNSEDGEEVTTNQIIINSEFIHILDYVKDTLKLNTDQLTWLIYGEFALGNGFKKDLADELPTITLAEAKQAIQYLIDNPDSHPSADNVCFRKIPSIFI